MQTTYIDKPSLLKRGWDDSLIEYFLEYSITIRNPNYSSSDTHITVWELDEVEKIEKTKSFKKLKKESDDNNIVNYNITKLNSDDFTKYITDAISDIKVKIISKESLDKNVIKFMNTYPTLKNLCYYSLPSGHTKYRITLENVNVDEFMKWSVRYVLISLVTYNKILYRRCTKMGNSRLQDTIEKREQCRRYRNAVLDKISWVYPHLKSECDKRKRDVKYE